MQTISPLFGSLLIIAVVITAVFTYMLSKHIFDSRKIFFNKLKSINIGKYSASNKSVLNVNHESSLVSKPLHDKRFSIGVLLFETLSNNESDEFISSGITSEIIKHVTNIPNIRISSRLTAYNFKSNETDIKYVADKLNSRFILTGSMQRDGNNIRVTAQLSDIETNSLIWNQSYNRQIKDLFGVQHDIAKCIVGTVLGEVKLAETLFAGAIPEYQLDAWGLVQKAYHFWLTSFTPQGILDACDYLRDALEIEPEYANARATLAMLMAQQMTTRICKDYDLCCDAAEELIETAYSQAPNDIEVLENAGVTWQNLGQSKRSINALRRVVKIAPLNLIARGYLALVLSMTGGRRGALEAITLIQDNFATAPKHPSAPYWNYFQAVAEQRLGNTNQAIELAKLSLSAQPGWVHNYYLLANAYCLKQQPDAAKKVINIAKSIVPSLTTQLYADNVYKITGGKKNAESFVGGLVDFGLIT